MPFNDNAENLNQPNKKQKTSTSTSMGNSTSQLFMPRPQKNESNPKQEKPFDFDLFWNEVVEPKDNSAAKVAPVVNVTPSQEKPFNFDLFWNEIVEPKNAPATKSQTHAAKATINIIDGNSKQNMLFKIDLSHLDEFEFFARSEMYLQVLRSKNYNPYRGEGVNAKIIYLETKVSQKDYLLQLLEPLAKQEIENKTSKYTSGK